MFEAILLDGTRNPVAIRINDKELGEFKSGRKKSMTWAGSADAWRRDAENPPKYFNFVRTEERDGKEVLIFMMVGLKEDQLVPGLRLKDLDEDANDELVTVKKHGDVLAEQFLYPEKYALMGRMEVAA